MQAKLFAFLLVAVLGLGLFSADSALAHGPLSLGGWLNTSVSVNADEFAAKVSAMFQSWANILGLSLETIKSGWAEGKTALEIAAENGVTKEQVQANLKTAKQTEAKTRLQVLVDKGVITQAQADARLQAMASSSDQSVSGKGKFHGFLGFGFGRWHDWEDED